MTAHDLLRNPVSLSDYDRGRASAITPDSLVFGDLYTARLLLEAKASAHSGIIAVDTLVEVRNITLDPRLFATIQYVDDDGRPTGEIFAPRLDNNGIIHGRIAPVPTKEGYFLNSTTDLEDELMRMEEEALMRIPIKRPAPLLPIRRY